MRTLQFGQVKRRRLSPGLTCTAVTGKASALAPSVLPSTVSTASRCPSQRFVKSKLEKAWVFMQILAFGAPLQKLKTSGATVVRIADSAKTRLFASCAMVSEQNCYGMSWQRSHILCITGENVRLVANTVLEMAKKVVITYMSVSLEGGCPVKPAQSSEDDAQHILDQFVLDFKDGHPKRRLRMTKMRKRLSIKTKNAELRRRNVKRS